MRPMQGNGTRRWAGVSLGLALALMVLTASEARAQRYPGRGQTSVAQYYGYGNSTPNYAPNPAWTSAAAQRNGAMMATQGSLFSNPMLNPYLNPALTQMPMNRDTALLYMLAARQQAGAIGSGRLSGVHPAPGMGMPGRNVPRFAGTRNNAGGAAHYFNRGISTPAGPARFQRYDRYFNSIGR